MVRNNAWYDVNCPVEYMKFTIATNEKRKLVCVEASDMGLAAYSNQNSSYVLDFLCEIKYPLNDLVECMNKFDNFKELEPEQQKVFLDRFNNYFENIEKQDAEYLKMCIPAINNVFFQ